MPQDKDCLLSMETMFADTVRGVALVIFGTGARDKMLLAEISVTSSITELMQAENATKKELADVVQRVRVAQQQKSKAGIKDLLHRSMHLRTTLATISAKRMGMQKQLETLRQSQLNQNMLQSMKHTSEALQTMGLKVTDADNIMLDLEDSTSDINSLTTTLGSSFASTEITDGDLSKELELILSDDNLEPVFYNKPERVDTRATRPDARPDARPVTDTTQERPVTTQERPVTTQERPVTTQERPVTPDTTQDTERRGAAAEACKVAEACETGAVDQQRGGDGEALQDT